MTNRRKRIYEIALIVCCLIIISLTAYMGITAIQKSLTLNLKINTMPTVFCQLDVSKDNGVSWKTIFCNDPDNLKIGNNITLSGDTLTLTSDYMAANALGSTFILKLTNLMTDTLAMIPSGNGVSASPSVISNITNGQSGQIKILSISSNSSLSLQILTNATIVELDSTNCTLNGDTIIQNASTYSAVISASDDAILPETITITLNGSSFTDFVWDSNTGELTLNNLTGKTGKFIISVTAITPTYWSGGASTTFQGSGTSESPYLIYTGEDLALLASGTTYISKHLKLMDDIYLNRDFKNYENWGLTDTDKNIWRPGSFSGVLDGNGKTIYGLYTDSTKDYQGLFQQMVDATITNLSISHSYIVGTSHVGALCGDWSADARSYEERISNVSNFGNVYGSGNDVGGLMGSLWVDETNFLIGHCYNYGSVTGGSSSVGGILGGCDHDAPDDIILQYCANFGDVIGGGHVGGIVGYGFYNKLYYCYNEGAITGEGAVGGIAGANFGYSDSRILHSYNTGKVSSTAISVQSYTRYDIGGIVGYGDGGSIEYSYNIGEILFEEVVSSFVGGITGYIEGDDCLTSTYWLSTCGASRGIGNLSSDTNATPKTQAELKMQTTYVGWENDFGTIWAIDSTGVINDGYPYLINNPPRN